MLPKRKIWSAIAARNDNRCNLPRWCHNHKEQLLLLMVSLSDQPPSLSKSSSPPRPPDATRAFFQAQRTPAGEELILQKNLFIEYLLPLRNIAADAMEVYRRHYRNPGPARQPMLTWTRELPIAGQVAELLAGRKDPRTAVYDLMLRPQRAET